MNIEDDDNSRTHTAVTLLVKCDDKTMWNNSSKTGKHTYYWRYKASQLRSGKTESSITIGKIHQNGRTNQNKKVKLAIITTRKHKCQLCDYWTYLFCCSSANVIFCPFVTLPQKINLLLHICVNQNDVEIYHRISVPVLLLSASSSRCGGHQNVFYSPQIVQVTNDEQIHICLNHDKPW